MYVLITGSHSKALAFVNRQDEVKASLPIYNQNTINTMSNQTLFDYLRKARSWNKACKEQGTEEAEEASRILLDTVNAIYSARIKYENPPAC